MYVNANNMHLTFNPNELADDGVPAGTDPGQEPGTSPETEPMPTYLTPDALLVYCRSRLQGLDAQIQQGMQTQENVNYDQQQLEPVQAALSQYANGCPDANSVQQLAGAVQKALTSIQNRDPGSPAIPMLQNMLSGITSGTNTSSAFVQNMVSQAQKMGLTIDGLPPALTSNQIQDFTTTLSQITSAENSGAEINMINLQSLMSQRQTAVELTTNMMQTIDDTLSKVVSNVGH